MFYVSWRHDNKTIHPIELLSILILLEGNGNLLKDNINFLKHGLRLYQYGGNDQEDRYKFCDIHGITMYY